MTETVLSDIGYHEPTYNNFFLKESLVKTLHITGGLVEVNPTYNALASAVGMRVANIPYFNDIGTPDSSVASDVISEIIPENKVGTGEDRCIVLRRNTAWGSMSYIQQVLSSVDPLGIVIRDLTGYWLRERQKILNYILKGVIDNNIANYASDMVVDISGAGKKYHTYIFAPGAIALGIGNTPMALEYERQAKTGMGSGSNTLVTRSDFLFHPKGLSYTDAVVTAGAKTPTYADLANPLNWTRTGDRKSIRFVCIISNSSVTTPLALAENLISPSALITAAQTLGDTKDGLSTILMHSDVETDLEKLDVVDTMLPSEGSGAPIRVYRDKRVLMSDQIHNWV